MVLSPGCPFSDCFMGHVHKLESLEVFLKRFPIALHKSAIIQHNLYYWETTSRGDINAPSGLPPCATLLADAPAQVSHGWLAALTVLFYTLLRQSSPSKLFSILHQAA